jgi:hypothetical protein
LPQWTEAKYITVYVAGSDDDINNGCTSCNGGVGAPAESVGKPINVTNGNMYIQQADYQLPGIGHELQLVRTYNSNSRGTGIFGTGWSSTYEVSIIPYGDTFLRLS